MCLWPKISPPKLGQIEHVGGVLKLPGPADSKTDTGFEICPRFVGVTGQNKIQRTYDHDCINLSQKFCIYKYM